MPADPQKLRSHLSLADREIISSRLFPYPRKAIFNAFADPAQLARWWGPAGFSNTIHEFNFTPRGKWLATMHAPDGTHHHHERRFVDIAPDSSITYDHIAPPENPAHAFRMIISFTDRPPQTHLIWHIVFESSTECARVKPFILPANEQNFDRLAAHLAAHSDSKLT